ncbi:MAG TPA: hypothetical protein VJ385_20885 [Fibrobacteria bacterium]|nr:hypothetical protein [Fibrobacteria bacterium]
MTVWTKAQFRTDSGKFFSKRDGTIAEIDTALDGYHGAIGLANRKAKIEDLYSVINKFEAEKKLKHQNNPAKQSAKRRDSVARLKVQVENERWQLDYDGRAKERRDFKKYFKKKRKKEADHAVLADWLERLKIQVKQGEAKTNKLKKDLHSSIEAFFDPGNSAAWETALNDGEYPGRVGYIGGSREGGYTPSDTIRVATVDLESVLGGGAVDYVMFGSKDNPKWAPPDELSAMFGKVKAGGDPLVGPKQSQNQAAELFPRPMRKLMEDYLRALLRKDLEEQVELVKRALESQDGYRAVVHLDYYATRSTTQVGLHKDTTGNNVFAVLHYINDDPMLGPEYIDDPAPIRTANEGYYYDRYWSAIGDDYYRQAAPWAILKDGMCTWPDALLEGLQIAREAGGSKSRGKMACSILPRDGLVAFVDELIFHATPIEGHRVDDTSDEAVRYLSAGVTVVSLMKAGVDPGKLNIFGTKSYADRIKRRLSATYDKGTHLQTGLTIPGAKSGGVRKFFRLWICIVPEHWYTPLPPYP